MWDPYAEFETAILPNGLTVHVLHWPERSWVKAGFLVHSGARLDPDGLEGTAHMTEHLVSENVDLPCQEVRSFFETVGGNVSFGVTGFRGTKYSFDAPADKSFLKKALEIFGQMLLSAKIEKFVEREREVIFREFHSKYQIPIHLDHAWKKQRALYAGTWRARFVTPMGVPESIERITQDDLQSFYEAHYTPANTSLVFVGGVTLQETVDLLTDSPFGFNKPGRRTGLLEPDIWVSPPQENRYVFKFSEHIKMENLVKSGEFNSTAVIPGAVEYDVLRVIKHMLGKMLFEEVRERRAWVYSINAHLYSNRQFHELSIGCAGLKLVAVDQIEDVVNACVDEVASREDLFDEVHSRLIGHLRLVDPSGSGLRDNAMVDLEDEHRILSLQENIEQLERIGMQDVRDALKRLVPERRYTVLTIP